MTLPKDRLKSRALSGAALIGLAQAIKLVTQMASVVLLARLIAPGDFGLFAMVMPIVAFIMMFQDLGLTQATITRKTLSVQEANTLFWLSAAAASTLAITLLCASPLVAIFYGEPRLTNLVATLSFAVFTSGLVSQHLALLSRQMRFGALAAIDIASTIIAFAASILVASIHPSPWAMVASVLAGMGTSLVLVWLIVGWLPGRPALSGIGDLLRFSGGLSLFNITTFIARNSDKVLIGRFVGSTPLGLYDRGYRLLLFPLQQVSYPLARIAIPILSRLTGEPHRYHHAYARLVRQMLLLITPGMVMLILFSERLIRLLLGNGWEGVVPIFQWLGIAGLVLPVTASIAWLFTSQGRAVEFGQWGLFSMFTCLGAYCIGLRWGAVGVAAAYTLSELLIRVPLLWWWVGRRGPVSAKALFQITAPFLLVGAVSAATLLSLERQLGESDLLSLIFGGFTSYVAGWTSLLLLPAGRRMVQENVSLASGVLNHGRALIARRFRAKRIAAE